MTYIVFFYFLGEIFMQKFDEIFLMAGWKVVTAGGKVLSLIGHSLPHIKKDCQDLENQRKVGDREFQPETHGSEFLYYIIGFNRTKA